MAIPDNRRALVLTGGGARGAYQVGVLKFLAEHVKDPEFKILLGSSAGAINVAALASQDGDFKDTVGAMEEIWAGLKISDVLKIDLFSLLKMAIQWAMSLIFSGISGKPTANSLIDSSPLSHLIKKIFKPENVARALAEKKYETLAITATEVATASSVTFVQSPHHKTWSRANRRSEAAVIGYEHILASSAIPFLFKSVLVGRRQYIDGSVRSNTPLSPAARLGATEIFSIGVRRVTTSEDQTKLTDAMPDFEPAPTASQIGGLILNSLFSDALDADADHLVRINGLLEHVDQETALNVAGLKPIEVCLMRPSEDIGRIATRYTHRLPIFLRYLLRSLGSEQSRSSDIVSYLLFDHAYTRHLIDLGYRDAEQQREKLLRFFSKPSGRQAA